MPPSNRGEPILAYPEGLTICPVCEIGFVPGKHSAKFCSDAHRVRAAYAAKKRSNVLADGPTLPA
jgi:hypothetical protein